MRASQFIEAVNLETLPSSLEFRARFTHIDKQDVLKARKILRSNKKEAQRDFFDPRP